MPSIQWNVYLNDRWMDKIGGTKEDGFKTQRQSWHEALCEYATSHKLRATYERA